MPDPIVADYSLWAAQERPDRVHLVLRCTFAPLVPAFATALDPADFGPWRPVTITRIGTCDMLVSTSGRTLRLRRLFGRRDLFEPALAAGLDRVGVDDLKDLLARAAKALPELYRAAAGRPVPIATEVLRQGRDGVPFLRVRSALDLTAIRPPAASPRRQPGQRAADWI